MSITHKSPHKSVLKLDKRCGTKSIHPGYTQKERERPREPSGTDSPWSHGASPCTIPVSRGTVCAEQTVIRECASWVHGLVPSCYVLKTIVPIEKEACKIEIKQSLHVKILAKFWRFLLDIVSRQLTILNCKEFVFIKKLNFSLGFKWPKLSFNFEVDSNRSYLISS